MKILRHPDLPAAENRPVCLAIGMFDGVHLGHQQVIRQAVGDAGQNEARSVVVTFDRHPRSVVRPDQQPPLILPLAQKLEAIAALGVEATLLLTFDAALQRMEPEAFVTFLRESFGRIVSICVGSRFVFGHRRRGNVQLLQSLGRELGFSVHGLAAVALDQEPVSSTRIRRAIQESDFDTADQMLGRPYTLWGEVGEGRRLGTQLGFPTANLKTAGLALPGNGVYAAHAGVGGRTYRAVVNIGVRPTLKEPESAADPVVEAHLLDVSRDLYGQLMGITFSAKLRDEMRFPSREALAGQIQKDIARAREIFRDVPAGPPDGVHRA